MHPQSSLSATVTPNQWRIQRRLTALPLDQPGRLTLEPGIELFGPIDQVGDYLKFSLGDLALTCLIDDFLLAISKRS